MRKNLMICGLIISFSLLCTIANAQITFTLNPGYGRIFAGEDTSLYVGLKNDGARSLSDVSISINMPDQLGGKRQFTVSSIASGSTYTKTIQVFTDNNTQIGRYTINATVAYGGETLQYPNITLEVAEFPLLIDYNFLHDSINAGEQNSIIVNVKNIGSISLTNLELSIDYPGGFITNATKYVSVPEMAPNLAIEQEFAFTAPADANGDYHVGVKIDFKEGDKLHSLQRYAKLYVSGPLGFGWLETLLTIIIVLLIVLILWGKVK